MTNEQRTKAKKYIAELRACDLVMVGCDLTMLSRVCASAYLCHEKGGEVNLTDSQIRCALRCVLIGRVAIEDVKWIHDEVQQEVSVG